MKHLIQSLRIALVFISLLPIANGALAQGPLVYFCGSYNANNQTLTLADAAQTPIQIAVTKDFAVTDTGCFIGTELPGTLGTNRVFVAHDFHAFPTGVMGPVGLCGQITHPSESETWLWLHLGINPPRLSEVLNGKKGLSVGAAARISARLTFNNEETEYFCDLVRMKDARSVIDRKVAMARVQRSLPTPNYLEVSLDSFHLISEWYHFAIFELTSLKGFRSDLPWIAQKLGISLDQAKIAVNRMIRLKLLKKVEGKLVKAQENITTTNDIPSEAIRNFNLQILRKAIQATVDRSVEERDLSTLTMAVLKERLPEAKQAIKKFRRQFSAQFESSPSDDVYCLAIQFFSLLEKNKE